MALLKQPPGSVTDRFTPCSRDVRGGVLAAVNVANSAIGVIRRPGVIHADRETEIIARLRRRMRAVLPDRRQGPFIPNARHAVGGSAEDILPCAQHKAEEK